MEAIIDLEVVLGLLGHDIDLSVKDRCHVLDAIWSFIGVKIENQFKTSNLMSGIATSTVEHLYSAPAI